MPRPAGCSRATASSATGRSSRQRGAPGNSTGQSTASGQGVQLAIKPITDTLFASLTLPSGPHRCPCSIARWQLVPVGHCHGDLITDSFPARRWAGGAQQDSVRGAMYQLSAQAILAQENVSTAILPQDVPTGVAATAFPLPDGLSASSPLTCTQIQAGLRVTWSAWAAANPRCACSQCRAGHRRCSPALGANRTALPPVGQRHRRARRTAHWHAHSLPVVMVAHDKLGRRYISRIVASIP